MSNGLDTTPSDTPQPTHNTHRSAWRGLRRRMLLVAAMALVGLLATPPRAESAGQDLTGKFWVLTPEAAIRTQQGDCAAGEICKELCMFVDGDEVSLGFFSCFPA